MPAVCEKWSQQQATGYSAGRVVLQSDEAPPCENDGRNAVTDHRAGFANMKLFAASFVATSSLDPAG